MYVVGIPALITPSACQRRSSLPPAATIDERKHHTPVPEAPKAVIDDDGGEAAPAEELAPFKMSASACWGSCPQFELILLPGGEAVWHGKSNVFLVGKFRAKYSAEWYQEIIVAAEKTRYFNLKSQYPWQSAAIPGLPVTVTQLRHNGKLHRIANNADAPTELVRFEQFIYQHIQSLNWRPE